MSVFYLYVLGNEYVAVSESYEYTAIHGYNYLVDMAYVDNYQTFYLPTGMSNGESIYVSLNNNSNSSPCNLTILSQDYYNETVYKSDGSGFSNNGLRNTSYVFTYYTAGHANPFYPSNTGRSWTVTTSSTLDIPSSVSIIAYQSKTFTSPSSTFTTNMTVTLGNKCMVQFIDLGAHISYCPIALYRSDTSFTFQPEGTDHITINTNSTNFKRINIFGSCVSC